MPLFLSPVTCESSLQVIGTAGISQTLYVGGLTTLQGGASCRSSFTLPSVPNQAALAAFPPVLGNTLVTCTTTSGPNVFQYDEADTATPTAWPWAVRSVASGATGCWKIVNYASVCKETRHRFMTTGGDINIAHDSGHPAWHFFNVGTLLGDRTNYIVGSTVMDGGTVVPKAMTHYEVEVELDWLMDPWPGSTNVAGDYIEGGLYLAIDNDGSGGSGGPYYDPPGNTTTPSATASRMHQSIIALQADQGAFEIEKGVHGLRAKARLPARSAGADIISPYVYLYSVHANVYSGGLANIQADTCWTITIRAF